MQQTTLDLGIALGQNQAFSIIAGRCSAAQAATLLRLREERKYLECASNWREFCTNYLKISGSEADKIIRLWQEFGPEYFELAQLIKISPNDYRAIEPSVKEGAVHYEGEAIEIDPENSRKLATAVSELRANAKGTKKPPRQPVMHERIAALDRRCTAIIQEFEAIAKKESCGENWLLFAKALTRVLNELARIEKDNGL